MIFAHVLFLLGVAVSAVVGGVLPSFNDTVEHVGNLKCPPDDSNCDLPNASRKDAFCVPLQQERNLDKCFIAYYKWDDHKDIYVRPLAIYDSYCNKIGHLDNIKPDSPKLPISIMSQLPKYVVITKTEPSIEFWYDNRKSYFKNGLYYLANKNGLAVEAWKKEFDCGRFRGVNEDDNHDPKALIMPSNNDYQPPNRPMFAEDPLLESIEH